MVYQHKLLHVVPAQEVDAASVDDGVREGVAAAARCTKVTAQQRSRTRRSDYPTTAHTRGWPGPARVGECAGAATYFNRALMAENRPSSTCTKINSFCGIAHNAKRTRQLPQVHPPPLHPGPCQRRGTPTGTHLLIRADNVKDGIAGLRRPVRNTEGVDEAEVG